MAILIFGTTLRETNLIYLYFLDSGVNLKASDLEGSQMTNVILRVATLKGANLQNCNLRGAILAGADLEVSFKRITLKNT
jgi:uncharacterized protein YjbI with pentapeptide repeats